MKDGARVTVGGLVLIRQRPGTAKGVVFATLEDETGIANAVVWPDVFAANRRTVMSASFLVVSGRLQRASDVIHVVAERFVDLSAAPRGTEKRRRGGSPPASFRARLQAAATSTKSRISAASRRPTTSSRGCRSRRPLPSRRRCAGRSDRPARRSAACRRSAPGRWGWRAAARRALWPGRRAARWPAASPGCCACM